MPKFQFLTFYLDCEGTNNIYVLYVPILGFGGHWKLLNRVWHLDMHLDVVTGLWYTWLLVFDTPLF